MTKDEAHAVVMGCLNTFGDPSVFPRDEYIELLGDLIDTIGKRLELALQEDEHND